MRVSSNRFAGQELIDAARTLSEVANLGGAFLDEYEAWDRSMVWTNWELEKNAEAKEPATRAVVKGTLIKKSADS